MQSASLRITSYKLQVTSSLCKAQGLGSFLFARRYWGNHTSPSGRETGNSSRLWRDLQLGTRNKMSQVAGYKLQVPCPKDKVYLFSFPLGTKIFQFPRLAS